ncbi:Protein trichome birefringence-like 4 [Raphanus sativus]|nr:Protein trichome birefringence-like 4 [Raphanus sativus]
MNAASDTATLYSVSPRRIRVKNESKKIDHATRELTSCDIFDGSWVSDDTEPVYSPGYCPLVEDKFNCFKTRTEFLGFLGDKVIYITKGSTVSDSKSPFLVQESEVLDGYGKRKETLRLDVIQGSIKKIYKNADITVFNTGHWWTHQKTYEGKDYFKEGNRVYEKLEVKDAYTKALHTWADWVDSNINSTRTRVLFVGYSSSQFRKDAWNAGGQCDGETRPIENKTYTGGYPWMMKVVESVISDMKTPVFYMNITKMTWYRTDGHPSVYRQPVEVRGSSPATGMFQDCSHWCLPGIPDSWNQLLYASFAWFLVLQVSWYSLLKWWLVLLSLFDQPLVFDLCKFFFFEKKH